MHDIIDSEPPRCFQRVRNVVLMKFDRAKPQLFHLLLLLSVLFSFLAVSVSLRSSPCWDSQGEYSLLQQTAPLTAFPLKHAHSHNDYDQAKPLVGALLAGFCSFEADVFLKNSQLFIGHQFITPTDQTLSLMQAYLLPLMSLSKQNANGPVYAQAIKLQTCLQVTLLVDIKSTNAFDTYKQLEMDLLKLNQNFTYFETFDGQQTRSALPAPIRVVVTGVKPPLAAEIARYVETQQGVRRTSLDLGWINDDTPMDLEVMAIAKWVSLRWPFPKTTAVDDLDGVETWIKQRVQFAHDHGLLLRFWSTPEDPILWDLLLRLGVDLINTDRIFTLRSFLAGV